MNFEVYCDESGLEALSQKDAHLYTAIGGIWMPADYRPIFKEKFNNIKKKYGVIRELKWNKVSPKFFDLHKEIIDSCDPKIHKEYRYTGSCLYFVKISFIYLSQYWSTTIINTFCERLIKIAKEELNHRDYWVKENLLSTLKIIGNNNEKAQKTIKWIEEEYRKIEKKLI